MFNIEKRSNDRLYYSPLGPVGPVGPVAPRGIVRFNTKLGEVPVIDAAA